MPEAGGELMLLTALPLLLATTGAPDSAWLTLWEQCRSETTSEVRLACYDALSREGGRAGAMSSAEKNDGFHLQREANGGDMTLTRSLADGNQLVVSCTSNITHLRLTLVTPWVGEAVNVQLDGIRSADSWFVRNHGQLLEYGRGLPAIDALKRWMGHQQLVLSDASGKPLRIDLTGLTEALTPLRQQCHW
ncbi:type VI secretion system-associated protein VasI [Candidatus Symbiopectobacterium sp. NZEC151]|uniref:type VI secretion system-associated protein VasI n=1 Tax=Candidatus Symbiopectobacterium sp. NZEC151 TaxID=2820470 RepID=UPI0022260CED|nr:type VI secretion system-associated protein VasI [Candidatus Symbiopectobacterium sp. NZEC151]